MLSVEGEGNSRVCTLQIQFTGYFTEYSTVPSNYRAVILINLLTQSTKDSTAAIF